MDRAQVAEGLTEREQMKFFKRMKDGGPESKVVGYFLAEVKSLFSVVLLHFSSGSREAYHSHAFNSLSWVLKGGLLELEKDGYLTYYGPSLKPIWTPRSRFHKVFGCGSTWVLSFRGPWTKYWLEYLPDIEKTVALTHGRKVVN